MRKKFIVIIGIACFIMTIIYLVMLVLALMNGEDILGPILGFVSMTCVLIIAIMEYRRLYSHK